MESASGTTLTGREGTLPERVFDLRQTPSSRLQTAISGLLQDFPYGGRVVLHFAENPDLVLQSLNLSWRNAFSWTQGYNDESGWTAVIRHAEEVFPTDVADALKRDHQRLDALFARVIHQTDRGELLLAAQTMQDFIDGIGRHLGVEHDMLTAGIRMPPDVCGMDPGVAMMAEHREILAQSALILEAFGEADAGVASVSPFLAILAGYLSKHEQREEEIMLPAWSRALSQTSEAARKALLKRVVQLLG